MVEITLGIRDIAAPLTLDVDMTVDELREKIDASFTSDTALNLTSHDGSTVIVPAKAIGFVRIANSEQRRVGFGFV